MSDLISRQVAIELADSLKDELPDDERVADCVMAHNEGILEYQTALSLLPSAQQWIPCSERLPEENAIVLATTADFMYIVEFEVYSNGHMYWNEVNEYRSIADVIAWMPLPEPYKGEES